MKIKGLILTSLIIITSPGFSSSFPRNCPEADEINKALNNENFQGETTLSFAGLGSFHFRERDQTTGNVPPGRIDAFFRAELEGFNRRSGINLSCFYEGRGTLWVLEAFPENPWIQYTANGNNWTFQVFTEVCRGRGVKQARDCLFFINQRAP